MKIGVLGGGQLGKMLAMSAKGLGHECVFYDEKADVCAASEGEVVVGEFTDTTSLQSFADQCDVITYEFENIPVETVEFLRQHKNVFPSETALRTTQDRVAEKSRSNDLGIPTAAWEAVSSPDELHVAIETIGYPCILKTRRMGYDGKGQVFMRSEEDLPQAEDLVSHQECILEQCVHFEREVSIISTRSQDGDIVFYPLSENVHKEGILHISRSPCTSDTALEDKARHVAKTMLEDFDYVGTLAIELFVLSDGILLLNELAPRVHNSGHWTIEGVQTSQFENHMRAVSGMPLDSVEPNGHSAMVNIIGTFPPTEDLQEMDGVHIHMYGKAERPKRKIGHITICHSNQEYVKKTTEEVEGIV